MLLARSPKYFFNHILFAISTNIFGKLCKNIYNGMEKRAQQDLLYLVGTEPVVACRKETYKVNLKD
jgi:hypothetical protein